MNYNLWKSTALDNITSLSRLFEILMPLPSLFNLKSGVVTAPLLGFPSTGLLLFLIDSDPKGLLGNFLQTCRQTPVPIDTSHSVFGSQKGL